MQECVLFVFYVPVYCMRLELVYFPQVCVLAVHRVCVSLCMQECALFVSVPVLLVCVRACVCRVCEVRVCTHESVCPCSCACTIRQCVNHQKQQSHKAQSC